jgi:DNA (cytosine-5)-methyltransferase 1
VNGSTILVAEAAVSTLAQMEPRTSTVPFVDVELFAGAGGLALGLSMAELPPDHLIELNAQCCKTLRHNAAGSEPFVKGHIHEEDVAEINWPERISSPVRLLSAGPPCQPFSLAGKHLAESDNRNEFPSTMRAVRALLPAAILFENVHGLSRSSFRPYLHYIFGQLECPHIAPRQGDLWQEHFSRIQKERESSGFTPLYNVTWRLINAADYGVPQVRSRVIILATRAGLPVVEIPSPTHSMAALVREQESGRYWDRHGLPTPGAWKPPKGPPGYARDPEAVRLPWLTVRDGLRGLADPPPENDSQEMNHWFIPGARTYSKHDGSSPDWPSKTIKAGVHGVAGGENIMRLPDGSVRYYTLREMARLQGFPDRYYFQGTRSRIIGQIGNAVPCQLARALGEALWPALNEFEKRLGSDATLSDEAGVSEVTV